MVNKMGLLFSSEQNLPYGTKMRRRTKKLVQSRSFDNGGCRAAAIAILLLSIAIFSFYILALHPFLTITSNKVSDPHICNRKLYPAPWQLRGDQLTVLMSGFAEARLSLLQQVALMYSASPVVHSIFVLWGNTSTNESVLRKIDFVSSGAPIFLVRQETSSLNDRFLPRPYVKTKAVVICDDDITIELETLKLAFQVWKENEDRIVGFFPRSHEYQLDSKSWIYTIHPNRYSIMLTKIMILASEFLFSYTCNMPEGVKEYIDQGMNCEDIAMNFVVSNYSNKGPLLVDGKPRDWGDTRNTGIGLSDSAISARGEHRKNRGDCITQFHRLWGGMPLQYSYYKAIGGVEEQVFCEKNGSILPCSEHINSINMG